jgi:ribonucleoside-diphosphate reductase alpha chain
MAKEGSTISGLMDAFATAVSLALQYGVPLADLINKFSHLRFEPAGFTTNPDVPMAKSLVDYIFRYLATKFLSRAEQDVVGVVNRQMTLSEAEVSGEHASPDAPAEAGSPPEAAEPQSASAPRQDAHEDSPQASASDTDVGQEEAESQPLPGLMDGLKIVATNGHAGREERLSAGQPTVIFDTADSPACTDCGSIMVRNGSCYKCLNCGSTSGCS